MKSYDITIGMTVWTTVSIQAKDQAKAVAKAKKTYSREDKLNKLLASNGVESIANAEITAIGETGAARVEETSIKLKA